MRIVGLHAENFKRLQVVEIAPDGNVVTIGGKNGSGKSSVLDAIYVALVGRAAAPPKPVREGVEKAIIKLDLGELIVTRTFTVKDGAPFTDTVKVETADGLKYPKPQQVLDALLGEIGFDPLEFANMKPAEQADTLLRMVPLSVDLDDLSELDATEFTARRDVNRDVLSLKSQVDAIPEEEVPTDLPDRQALADQLATAAQRNVEIEQDRQARAATDRNVVALYTRRDELRLEAAELRVRADEADRMSEEANAEGMKIEKELKALPPLPEPVDVTAVRAQLAEAEQTLARVDRQQRRKVLADQLAAKVAESEALTKSMGDREASRRAALAKAKMPIEGLAFALDEKGKPVVEFGGVPFEQASSAEQIRASTKIAMEANPQLRVLRIKDGSLLDDEAMGLLAEMAAADDFQLWIERVGTGGVGFVMEAGQVTPAGKAKAKAEPEKLL